MITITGIVALILIAVGLATSAILGSILQQNLRSQLKDTANRVQLFQPGYPIDSRDAATVLQESRVEQGFLLVLSSTSGDPTGAYIDADDEVVELTSAQIDQLVAGVDDPNGSVVDVTGLGDYLVAPIGLGNSNTVVGLAGVPMSEMRTTIAQILTTVGLVTAGGLVLLALAIAVVVRVSLRPLRSVADTATRVAAMPMSEGSVTIAERVPADQTDEHTEIGRVGHALNTLLDHVDASLDARQRNEERMRSFVADASHELRTPLASIRGFSELSLRALRQPGAQSATETTESSLERIQAQSLRMTTLVEDLLLLARLDEGQELVYGTVDLSQLAIEAVADARPAGPDHVWKLDLGEEPVVIAGDGARLHQVVANLLANARTHTPAGSVVTVSVARDGREAVLRVHDDGPGVDPAIADALFERFSRADRSRARKTGGTGLGLSIAKAIVSAHGGSIRVDSVQGDTTFEVRLPARPAVPGADQ
ncbi:HAMP domain-containing histidine kinase [Microbacterium fluvii]|nr:HAMP domain-containing histidine kinase [Microbacterium fluvii]